jgi:hypothetical protein
MPATIVYADVRVTSQNPKLTIYSVAQQEEFTFKILNKGGHFYPLRRHDQPLDERVHPEVRKTLEYVIVGNFELTYENKRALFRDRPPVIGRIEYLDPLGKRRELGFAFQPQIASGIPVANPPHGFSFTNNFDKVGW